MSYVSSSHYVWVALLFLSATLAAVTDSFVSNCVCASRSKVKRNVGSTNVRRRAAEAILRGRNPNFTRLSAVKFKNFDHMLSTYTEPILIDFHATNCGPCRLLQKELEKVRQKLCDDVKIFVIDTERFPLLGSRFDVEGLPTVLLFKDGRVVHRIVGFESADEIIRQVTEYL